jgi:hypothetical protein
MLKILLAASAVSLLLAGCATRDPRDAAWDPKPGQSLFEQLPNWDNAAERRCCGHLRQCGPNQTPRC